MAESLASYLSGVVLIGLATFVVPGAWFTAAVTSGLAVIAAGDGLGR